MYENNNTLSVRLTDIRNLIKRKGSEELYAECRRHIYHTQTLLKARFDEKKERVEARHHSPIAVSVDAIMTLMRNFRRQFKANPQEPSLARYLVNLALCTGSRPIELLCLANYTALPDERILMQGIAKKYKDVKITRLLYSSRRRCFFFEPEELVEMVKALRKQVKMILDARGVLNDFTESFRAEKFDCNYRSDTMLNKDDEPSEELLQRVSNIFNGMYSEEAQQIIPTESVRPAHLKDCRAIYATITYETLADKRQYTKSAWIAENLAHSDMKTAFHYEPVTAV